MAIDGKRRLRIALTGDGTPISWGAATNALEGQSHLLAVAAGEGHAVGLAADGTVVSWGEERYTPTNLPTALSGVVAIAAGVYHSVALKNDGTVAVWARRNTFGQTNVPPGLTGVVDIAAGETFSLAVKSDGTVVAWGDNRYGQTDVPADLRDVLAVAAGDNYSLAIVANQLTVSIAWAASRPLIKFQTFAGREYAVDYSLDPLSDSWHALPGGGVSGNGRLAEVVDSTAATDTAARYYRAVQLP